MASANAAGSATAPLRVLFLGNSQVRCVWSIVEIVERLARSAPARLRPLETAEVVIGGASLERLWTDDRCRARLAAGGWDWVVCNELIYSYGATGPRLRDYARRFSAEAARGGARLLLFATGETERAKLSPGDMYRDAVAAAHECGGRVAGGGSAWLKAWALQPTLDFHAPDRAHANERGYYLNACVILAALTDESPVGLDPCGLPPAEAAFLQEVAWRQYHDDRRHELAPGMMAYRVLYNQDCTNLFAVTKEPLTPAHVDRLVDEVAGGGADVMLINPNAQRVSYPSRVWPTFWDGYEPGNRAFFGPVPDAEVAGREAWVRQMKHLADQGCDYLARALARCREKGLAPGVTVRMNDMHDAPTPGTHLFSPFYMAHPELRLNNAAGGWSAKGLNYEHAAVREHFLALIRELVTAYDPDVVELDFLRFHCYFPRDHYAEHAAIMTGFLREVRALLNGTGRQIMLTARLAAHPAAAYELGFDVQTWAHEGLVDGISAGAFLNTQWRIAVSEYRALVGNDVAVYACTDYPADRRSGLPVRYLPLDPALLRGFAAGHLAAGADGVELFNFFCARETAWQDATHDPSFATLRELRTLAGLRGAPKTYTLTAGWAVGETDGPVQVPVPVETGQPRAFQVLLAAEPPQARAEVAVAFTGGAAVRPDQLWLQVNATPVGPASAVELLPAPAKDLRQALFTVPSAALRDGANELLLRNEGETLTVISLDLRVLA